MSQPDKKDKCVNEDIFCQKKAANIFNLTNLLEVQQGGATGEPSLPPAGSLLP